ncbi:SDR family oxidoreductase [Nocardia sp. NPDC004604]|uniref:SDR family oxidoreductase n=1 Tax=Nocardia sp. NPDC004604 TaxID=3157013 RepID=UPI0033B86AD7
MTMSSEKSQKPQGCVVVTGASTGIGAAAARELARRGFHVIAGVRRDQDADALRTDRIEPIILDITEPDHIAQLAPLFADDSRTGALRALVNNAAIQINAPVETLPLDEWRRQFEVNLFGHIAVTQALLPALLRNSGRVINISSVGGRVAMPAYGPYAATKFALEALSDSLRRELAPLGVRVVVVEPGAVRTEMSDRVIAATNQQAAAMSPEQRDRYGRLIQAVNAQAAAHIPNGRPVDDAARVIAKAVTAGKPRTRYTVGGDAALITRLSRVLPDRTLDRMLAFGLRPHYPTTSTA